MNFTIRAVLRTDKQDKKSLCPVAICVTVKRARTYRNTGIKIKTEQWDENTKRIKNHPNAVLLNAKLIKQLNETEGEMLRMEIDDRPVTLLAAKTVLRPEVNRNDFLGYATLILERIKKTNKPGTIRVYEAKLATLKAYEFRLSFADITPAFLNKYYLHLRDQGQQHNTTIASFKFIRLVFNKAIEEQLTTLYPFKEWKYPKYEEPIKQYLTVDERDKLEEQLYKNTLDKATQTVLAYFLVECYCGIRHSDWGKLRTERILHNQTLFLNTTKTGERITIPLDHYPALKRVVDYIQVNNMAYTYTLEFANRALKTIQGITEIKKKLTTHIGRHTAATTLLEAGISRETIAQVLGVSVKIVDTYAKLTGHKVTQEFKAAKFK